MRELQSNRFIASLAETVFLSAWVIAFVLASSVAHAEDRPAVAVTNVRRVFHNGEHNAFTDLCRFQGKIYLTFRSCPDGHMVHPTSSIIVLRSNDGQSWEQIHRFSVPKRDTRDPHFLVFRGKLFVFTGTWYCGETSPKSYDMNQQLGYAVWSEDGDTWSEPQLLEGTYGHYIWRASTHGGQAYLCARRKIDFAEEEGARDRQATQSAMLVSDDGLTWKTAAFFQEEWGDETAFLFEDDGSVIAVSRRNSNPAEICRSSPPYTNWDRTLLDRYIGGPLLVKWNGRYLVGGRKTIGGQGPKTSLCWLTEDQLQEFAELPSGGDNSYPGFVQLAKNRALVSWYSSHDTNEQGEPITAIYLAELEIRE